MWAYILRRLAYNVPVYLGIILFVMLALRVNDPVPGLLGKNPSKEEYAAVQRKMGLDQPFPVQYGKFLLNLVTADLFVGAEPADSKQRSVFSPGVFSTQSWKNQGLTVGELLRGSFIPSMAVTLPVLVLSTVISICVGMISAYSRGRIADRAWDPRSCRSR